MTPQQADYLKWQTAVQMQEEQNPYVQQAISTKVAEMTFRMKETTTVWGVVILAVPYVMKSDGQVPVKIFTDDKQSNFFGVIPNRHLHKEKRIMS